MSADVRFSTNLAEERLEFVLMRRQGMSVEEIRKKRMAQLVEAYNKKAAEINKLTNEKINKLSVLEGFAKESGNIDFLAAGKMQIEALKKKIEEFQEKQKKIESTLEAGKQEYALGIALGARLQLELKKLKRTLEETPPVIPLKGILHEGAGRLNSVSSERSKIERKHKNVLY